MSERYTFSLAAGKSNHSGAVSGYKFAQYRAGMVSSYQARRF